MNPPSRLRQPSADLSTTPKPATYTSRTTRNPRGPTVPPSASRATPSLRSTARKPLTARGVPNSTSLTHIRSLTAQMQRLEQRVHSARSKLPAPVNTPPRASPRSDSAMGHNYMPPSVTIRSRKRTIGSSASAASSVADDTPSAKHVSRLSTSGISRLSFGPLSTRENRDNEGSRPSSRASVSSIARPASRTEIARPASRTSEIARPASRTSMSGARTPLGHYSQSSLAESRRPRSSIGGSYAASHGHGHSQSVSNIDLDETRELNFSTPARRSTLNKSEIEARAIPTPRGLSRRQSQGLMTPGAGRRTSSGAAIREAEKKPEAGRPRKLSGVGETF